MIFEVPVELFHRPSWLTQFAWTCLGITVSKNFILGRYVIGYTVRNFVSGGCVGRAIKVISNCIYDHLPPQMEFFEYDNSHSNVLSNVLFNFYYKLKT